MYARNDKEYRPSNNAQDVNQIQFVAFTDNNNQFNL